MHTLATSTWDHAEIEAINNVVKSNQFSMDTKVREFESLYAKYHSAKYCVMVNSGSSANLLAIASLFFRKNGIALKRGDEIIVPAVSWSTTYAPLQQYGLKVKFIDIDPHTLNMDLSQLEKSITGMTKMILCVNLLGNPNDYDKINDIISNRDIILIEDNCEALGASFGGKMTGTFGLIGTSSSFFSHMISTIEGGQIITDDEELYNILLALRAHGWTREIPTNNKIISKFQDPFYESFRFVLPGYNVRPTEINGAIGIEQMKKLPTLISERRKNGEYYKKLFSGLHSIDIQQETGYSSWLGFAFIVRQSASYSRDQLIAKLRAAGIESRPIVAGNITKNEMIEYFDYEIVSELKNSDHIHLNGLFIGNRSSDISKALYEIMKIIKSLENNLHS